jgi:carboxymethylenebutenolidase
LEFVRKERIGVTGFCLGGGLAYQVSTMFPFGAIVEGMIKYKKTFEMKLYSGVQHAFFNEMMPSYNKLAAEDAWERAVSFFSKYLVK